MFADTVRAAKAAHPLPQAIDGLAPKTVGAPDRARRLAPDGPISPGSTTHALAGRKTWQDFAPRPPPGPFKSYRLHGSTPRRWSIPRRAAVAKAAGVRAISLNTAS